jgi:hypothetical protein
LLLKKKLLQPELGKKLKKPKTQKIKLFHLHQLKKL